MKSSMAVLLAASLAYCTQQGVTQAQPTAAQAQPAVAQQVLRTFHLHSAGSQAQQNEILTALRNTVTPNVKMFLVPSQNAIVVRAAPEEVGLIAELLKELDLPSKQYRLTYTLTETDNGKKVGVQRYSMVLFAGQRMQMKEGSRVPVITGSYSNADKATEKQTTYLDVGLSFDSTLQEYGSGFQLKSKVEQSSLAEEKSGVGPDDPVIRQALLEGTSMLTEGRSLALGSLDVVGSTRHIEVEAAVEPVR